jgi:hypothetical protein
MEVAEHGNLGKGGAASGKPYNRATRQGFTRRRREKTVCENLADIPVGRPDDA